MLGADSFARDPYGYLTNQAGHAFLGVALGVIATGFLSALWAWAAVGFAYWLIWEVAIQRGRMWRDSFEDAIFVTAGAALVCMGRLLDWWGEVGGLLGIAVLLGVGVYRRLGS